LDVLIKLDFRLCVIRRSDPLSSPQQLMKDLSRKADWLLPVIHFVQQKSTKTFVSGICLKKKILRFLGKKSLIDYPLVKFFQSFQRFEWILKKIFIFFGVPHLATSIFIMF